MLKETQQFIEYLKAQPSASPNMVRYMIAEILVTAHKLPRNGIPFAVATIIEIICATALAGKDIQEFQSAMDEITELLTSKSINRN